MPSTADPSLRRVALWHPGLIASGATLLIAALVTDVLYWQTLLFEWNNFSAWLILAGLLLAALAALALIVDLLRRRLHRIAWWRFAGLAVAVLFGVVDAFVHSRDAYTAVVPEGIILSAVVTVLLLAVGLGGGWSLESHHASAGPHARDTLR